MAIAGLWRWNIMTNPHVPAGILVRVHKSGLADFLTDCPHMRPAPMGRAAGIRLYWFFYDLDLA
jgi:hypothetical protein